MLSHIGRISSQFKRSKQTKATLSLNSHIKVLKLQQLTKIKEMKTVRSKTKIRLIHLMS